MGFTSITFFVFLFILFPLYWLAKKTTYQNIVLLVGGVVFYGWIHPWFAILLAVSITIDYLLSLAMIRNGTRRKLWLATSLVLNLGTLLLFKYFNFFIGDVNTLLSNSGLHFEPLVVNLLLPVGISFYTLKKISYIIDLYRKNGRTVSSFIDFALYVSFFPQVVAGPIDHSRVLMPQIQKSRRWSWDYLQKAWPLLVMGLFKKIVVADNVRVIADQIYGLQMPSKLVLLTGTLAFMVQILADFSAYTDMSRGSAFLLGFDTSENFKSPYLSLSPTDFWNRWHITLSNWLRDYIFYPVRRFLLIRTRYARSVLAWVLPPLVTMLVSGLWHGVGLNYVVWGFYHGVLIAAYQAIGINGNWKPKTRGITLLAWSIMALLVLFGWMIFRASSLGWLINILCHAPLIQTRNDLIVFTVSLTMIGFYSTPLIIKLIMDRYLQRSDILCGLYYATSIILLSVFINTVSPDFIYFHF
jgi:alginate O-acetyltransferase complex protein AlgI